MMPRTLILTFSINAVCSLVVFSAMAADKTFLGCADFPISFSSMFSFNCSDRSDVIYVESAIIGFSPAYKADRGQLECPLTIGTCVNRTTVPTDYCMGHNSCSFVQRILLYNESGLLCTVNGTMGNLGANFIRINYSCISRDFCVKKPGYRDRFDCSVNGTTKSSTTNSGTTITSASVIFTEMEDPNATANGTQKHLATADLLNQVPLLSDGAIIGVSSGAAAFAALLLIAIVALKSRKDKTKSLSSNGSGLQERLSKNSKTSTSFETDNSKHRDAIYEIAGRWIRSGKPGTSSPIPNTSANDRREDKAGKPGKSDRATNADSAVTSKADKIIEEKRLWSIHSGHYDRPASVRVAENQKPIFTRVVEVYSSETEGKKVDSTTQLQRESYQGIYGLAKDPDDSVYSKLKFSDDPDSPKVAEEQHYLPMSVKLDNEIILVDNVLYTASFYRETYA